MELVVSKKVGRKIHPLSQKIPRLSSRRDYINLGHLVRGGCLITGSPGSGKSTGSYWTLGRACLMNGHGALFLCCKWESVDDAIQLARASGRLKDVIVVRPKESVFRFIDYAISHHDEPESVISECVDALWSALQPMRVDLAKSSGENPFFSTAGRRLIGKLMLIDRLAEGSISCLRLMQMIQSIPPTIQAIEDSERFFVLRQIEKAKQNCPERQRVELSFAIDHLAVELVNLNHETKSSITITATNELSPMLEYPLFGLFNSDADNEEAQEINPDSILQGKIVILDCTVAKYPLAGRIAGCIWKRATQKAVLRRMIHHEGSPDQLIPVGLFADEASNWADPFDASYAERCRSARGYPCYTTQSVNTMIAAYGGSEPGKVAFNNLAANLQLRIAHANLCPATNLFHSESLGKHLVERESTGTSTNLPNGRTTGGTQGKSVNTNWVEEWILPPISCVGLQTGGGNATPPGVVEGIVIRAGERFQINEKRYLKVRFRQNLNVPRLEIFTMTGAWAINWARYVSPLDVLKGFARGWQDGRDMFYRWANFWGNGWMWDSKKPGGNDYAE